MESARSKFLKNKIRACMASEIKWKKKEALKKAKTKINKVKNLQEKENLQELSQNVLTENEDQDQCYTSDNVIVTVADVHNTTRSPTKKKCVVIANQDQVSCATSNILTSVTDVHNAPKSPNNKKNDYQDENYNLIPEEMKDDPDIDENMITIEFEIGTENSDYLLDTEERHNNNTQTEQESVDTDEPNNTPTIEEFEPVQDIEETNKIQEEGVKGKEAKTETTFNIEICIEQEPEVETPSLIAHNDPVLSREQSDELQPTITDIIPEEEMEIMRKSLEGENSEIPLPVDNESNTQNKKQTRRKTLKSNYVDFLSEEEDFVWDSTSWKDTDEGSSSNGEEPKKKRKKSKKNVGAIDGKVGDRGLKKKRVNRRLKEKEARDKGKGFVKKDGSIVDEKTMKPNPCVGKKCGHKCEDITGEKRQCIFDYFWSLSASKRKDWLVALSNKRDTKRKRAKDSGYRANTFEYFINEGEGRRQVCLKFLLKTLDISPKYVYYTVSNATYGLSKEDERGKSIPKNKISDATREAVKKFIKNLPALPSHYCRKDSTRLYLPVELKNLKNLYRIYKEDRQSQSFDFVSENIFRDIFNKEFNIGFHVSKKDKCIKCLRFESNPEETEAERKEHLIEKEASKTRLNCHRELGKGNPSILCTSFDLQKALNTPHGNSILLYYARKYTVYNLCFYENITREGYCFLWGECDGKRGGNEVATIIDKYISIVDSRGTIKHLILYSDSCPGQNKNKIVMAAVHNALLQAKNIESIQLNYLLPGHTEMSVDSMHSVIENSVRNTIIWAPSQWLTVCQVARKEFSPYHVQWIDHTDFKNFEEFSDKYFKGNLAGKVSKIRIATFKKSTLQNFSVKYSMQDDAKAEVIPVIARARSINPKLYKFLQPITKTKYNDLKKLCDTGVIPKIFHREYLTLPTGNVKDALIESDIEDDSGDEI